MRWTPPWLARAYARLYAAKKTDTFEFSEAGRILEVGDERPLAKTLAKLKRFGHLTVRRDPADTRRKLFRLIDPESIVLAMAIQSKAKTTDVTEKLREAAGFLDYYVNGAYAAYHYHRYSAPGTLDISVRPDQLPTWIALLSEANVALSTDDIQAERLADTSIHLHSDFEEKYTDHVRVIEEIRYLSPEILIILGIVRERPPLEDVLAILVVQRGRLNWETLLTLSDAYNASRFLGCLLEVLNFEARKPLFGLSHISGLRRRSNLHARLDFPSRLRGQPAEERYAAIASKWNLRLHVSHAVVSKITTDLVRP